MTRRIDNECPEIVIDQAVLGLIVDIRAGCQLANLVRRTGEKAPVLGVVLITLSVSPQYRGPIKLRIESNRKEMPVGGGVRHTTELLSCCLKILREPRTEIRNRAARKDERDGQGLAFEIAETNRLAELIRECIIKQRISWPRALGHARRRRLSCRIAAGRRETRPDDVVNPAFHLQIKKADSDKAATQWIFPAYNPVGQGQEADYRFEYRDLQMGYFTGLEVSHEPGQWLVWVGCVLMGVGLFVAFYTVHVRLWVVAVPDSKGKLALWIGGQANKNKDRFEQKFEDVVESIREELDRASIAPRSTRKEEEAKLTLVAVK